MFSTIIPSMITGKNCIGLIDVCHMLIDIRIISGSAMYTLYRFTNIKCELTRVSTLFHIVLVCSKFLTGIGTLSYFVIIGFNKVATRVNAFTHSYYNCIEIIVSIWESY